ncbi:MAG: hypothetical protein CME90_14705 [Hoeflea sp.]|nr:hypothetical protein [Hoeflea sp.]
MLPADPPTEFLRAGPSWETKTGSTPKSELTTTDMIVTRNGLTTGRGVVVQDATRHAIRTTQMLLIENRAVLSCGFNAGSGECDWHTPECARFFA